MSSTRAGRIHRALIALLVTTYVLAGVIGLFAGSHNTRDRVLWVAFLGGGAVLILVGAFVKRLPPWLSVLFISIGAIAGGIALVWTILVPLAAAVLVALTFSFYRQSRPA
jgi:hypothetical protein